MGRKMNIKKQSIIEHVIYEFFGNGNLSEYEQLVEKDIKVHYPPSCQDTYPQRLWGRENVKAIDLEYSSAFQIKKIEINDLLLERNKVLVRWHSWGVHKGNFFNIKASHRHFDLTGQTIYQFNQDEKISEVWQAWDMLGLFKQIRDEKPNVPFSEDIKKLIEQASFLSERERDCIKYLLLGKTAKETACYMKLSFRTVEYYFENIKDKLGCFTKRELFTCARQLEKHHIL